MFSFSIIYFILTITFSSSKVNLNLCYLLVHMARILLLNPSMEKIYKGSKVQKSVAGYFPLNLLIVAKPLIEKGHTVKIIDFLVKPYDEQKFVVFLDKFKPEYVGITFTTPLYGEALSILDAVKRHNPKIITVAGGAHISAQAKDALMNSKLDIAVIGEGDFTLLEIVESVKSRKGYSSVPGIAYKNNVDIVDITGSNANEADMNKAVVFTQKRKLIENLDIVPFPALELIDIYDYNIPHTISRENPVFPLETSRGCIFGCVFCNKSVFGRAFRMKSVERVMAEIRKIKNLGFKEVHIMDDGFTSDREHAKQVCLQLIDEKINLKFNCLSGIRADMIDIPLLKLMKKAGFYRVSIGVETGSQRVLDQIGKKMKLSRIEDAVKMIKKTGIEVLAYFMFGLPGETEEDMQKTIDFAKKLSPDVVKFDIMIPLPDTPIYREWDKKGIIVSHDWNDYHFHSKRMVYKHPNLSWEIIFKYLHKSYREFYLSPKFLFKRLLYSLKNGLFLEDLKVFLSTRW